MLPSATGIDDDTRLRTARKDNKVTAMLHTGYPVRHWDHDLGPDAPHLFDCRPVRRRAPLISHRTRATRCAKPHFDVSPDGSFVVTTWQRPGARRGAPQHDLVRIDVATAQRTVIVDDPDADLGLPGDLARRTVGGVHPRDHLDAPSGHRESRCASCGSAMNRSS